MHVLLFMSLIFPLHRVKDKVLVIRKLILVMTLPMDERNRNCLHLAYSLPSHLTLKYTHCLNGVEMQWKCFTAFCKIMLNTVNLRN